jgi:membrane-associated phospholipid phosphatase
MDPIQTIDAYLTQYISPYWVRQEPLLTVFRFLSLEGNWVIVWITLFGAVCVWELTIHKNRNRFAHKIVPLTLSALLVILILSVGIHWGLKPLVGRLRPFVVQHYLSIVCPHDFSFPSGHAAIATALASLLVYFDHNKRRHLLYIFIAFFVSYSRMALQCHYLFDVLIGAWLGILVAGGGKWAIRRYFPRFQDSSPPHKI